MVHVSRRRFRIAHAPPVPRFARVSLGTNSRKNRRGWLTLDPRLMLHVFNVGKRTLRLARPWRRSIALTRALTLPLSQRAHEHRDARRRQQRDTNEEYKSDSQRGMQRTMRTHSENSCTTMR